MGNIIGGKKSVADIGNKKMGNIVVPGKKGKKKGKQKTVKFKESNRNKEKVELTESETDNNNENQNDVILEINTEYDEHQPLLNTKSINDAPAPFQLAEYQKEELEYLFGSAKCYLDSDPGKLRTLIKWGIRVGYFSASTWAVYKSCEMFLEFGEAGGSEFPFSNLDPRINSIQSLLSAGGGFFLNFFLNLHFLIKAGLDLENYVHSYRLAKQMQMPRSVLKDLAKNALPISVASFGGGVFTLLELSSSNPTVAKTISTFLIYWVLNLNAGVGLQDLLSFLVGLPGKAFDKVSTCIEGPKAQYVDLKEVLNKRLIARVDAMFAEKRPTLVRYENIVAELMRVICAEDTARKFPLTRSVFKYLIFGVIWQGILSVMGTGYRLDTSQTFHDAMEAYFGMHLGTVITYMPITCFTALTGVVSLNVADGLSKKIEQGLAWLANQYDARHGQTTKEEEDRKNYKRVYPEDWRIWATRIAVMLFVGIGLILGYYSAGTALQLSRMMGYDNEYLRLDEIFGTAFFNKYGWDMMFIALGQTIQYACYYSDDQRKILELMKMIGHVVEPFVNAYNKKEEKSDESGCNPMGMFKKCAKVLSSRQKSIPTDVIIPQDEDERTFNNN